MMNLRVSVVFFIPGGSKEVPIEDLFLECKDGVYSGRAGAGNIQFEQLDIEAIYTRLFGKPESRSFIYRTYYNIYDGEELLFCTSGLLGNSDEPETLKYLSFEGRRWRGLISRKKLNKYECIDAVKGKIEGIDDAISTLYWGEEVNSDMHEKVIDILEHCWDQLIEVANSR
jgi:hypothetical protein